MPQHPCRSQRTTCRTWFSQVHAGPEKRTQVVKFGDKLLYLLSHPAIPVHLLIIMSYLVPKSIDWIFIFIYSAPTMYPALIQKLYHKNKISVLIVCILHPSPGEMDTS